MRDPKPEATEARLEQAMEWLQQYHPRLAGNLRAKWREGFFGIAARLDAVMKALAQYHRRLAQKLWAEWRHEDAATALDEAEERAAQERAREASEVSADAPSLWSRFCAGWLRYWRLP